MPEPEPSILDETALAELAASVGGDDAFVVELVETYLGDAPEQIAEIRAAAAANDADALVRPAHTLKSSSATVGAARLAARSRRLEMAGRSGAIEDDATLDDLRGMDAEWDAAATALRAWIDGAAR